MKEHKETTFKNELSDDMQKAMSYAKRLMKIRFYHSKTIEMKLRDRYTSEVTFKVMNRLKNESYFDDKLYVEKIKKICIKKYYGIKRMRKMLRDKGIKFQEYIYTFEEEKDVLDEFLRLANIKYQNLETDEFDKKIAYLLRYKGFSDYNIRKLKEI